MGESLFRYRDSGARFHISQGETLFRGRLYFVTPASEKRASSTKEGKFSGRYPPTPKARQQSL